jgi:Domain of unknown function (DUF4145)
MRPQFIIGNVRANCPTCGGAVSTFEHRANQNTEYGSIVLDMPTFSYEGNNYTRIMYKLLKCAGCGKGGMAEIYTQQNHPYGHSNSNLVKFYPYTIDKHPLPKDVPPDIRKEFEESELCASVQAWRSASAMLRSVLEKTLKENGYDNRSDNLQKRIDQAAADGTITEARAKRAHDNIRVLGNDILHDVWREVTQEEFDDAHLYAQRVLEDFYDDRPTVEALLTAKGRIKPPSSP